MSARRADRRGTLEAMILRRSMMVALVALMSCNVHTNHAQSSIAQRSVHTAPLDPDDPDRDGVRGALDRCPNAAEDMDRVADEDGCPEVDQDCDHIEDQRDVCALQPEDVDRWQDEDGCPDEDNDGDNVPDRCDQCPTQPETQNGHNDYDGCPDQALVRIEGSQIRILPQLRFDRDSAEVPPNSAAMIDEVARALNTYPHIQLVAVEGHASTDERDAQRLSMRRAEAVLRALVQRGVNRDRLVARAYGTTRPIDSERTLAGRERNRRAQWTIERSSQAVESAPQAPEPAPVCAPAPAAQLVAGGCPLPR